jgi:predicted alpha/beta-hydrolase family hydrolase
MSAAKVFSEEGVTGFIHEPASEGRHGLILAHGAGGNSQAPLLVAVANAFACSGFCVLRFDLPFRLRRRFGPPFPAQAAEDRDGIKAAVAAIRKLVPGRVFFGGHSYGGRQASIVASDEGAAPDALLLLSYPLHPPNKPNDQRTAHFPALHVPCLFVHGTRDPFGAVEELQHAIALIPATTKLSFIEQAGHDLARGKFDIPGLIVQPFQKLAAIA